MSRFQESYGAFKLYATPLLAAKNIRRFDREFWRPAACAPAMAVLEVGCGTGLFLAYLAAKGVTDFLGIDIDPELQQILPPSVGDRFRAVDVRTFLEAGAEGRTFDRIVMLDVLEHFAPDEGATLLEGLGRILRPGGRILVKVPNMASPWGGQYQYGDLTHKAAYTPSSLRHLALASGFICTAVYPHEEGSRFRRFRARLFHAFLGWMLMTPPEIWSANFFAILQRGE